MRRLLTICTAVMVLWFAAPQIANCGGDAEKIQSLISLARTTPAKIEDSGTGKAFPIFMEDMQQFAALDQQFAGAVGPEVAALQRDPEGFKLLQAFSRAMEKIGYDYDATVFQTYNDISPDAYYWLGNTRRSEFFLPVSMVLNNGEFLKKALGEGIISREAALAYLQGTADFISALSRQ